MNISVSEVEAVTVVMFEGYLETETAPEARARLDELMAAGTTRILLDFSDLDYIFSAGLAVLLATGKRLGAAGAVCDSAASMKRFVKCSICRGSAPSSVFSETRRKPWPLSDF